MKFLIITSTVLMLIGNCKIRSEHIETNCDSLDYKSAEYIYYFQMHDDTSFLDSAIMVIDIALKNCGDSNIQNKLKLRKIGILADLHKYQTALDFIKGSISDDILTGLPYYKRFLINRFNAMHFQHTEDYHKRDSCLSIIVFDIADFLDQNETEVSQLKKHTDPEHFLEDPLFIPLMQYYFYQSMLLGKTAFKTRLKTELSNDSITDVLYLDIIEFIETIDLMHFELF